MADKMGKRAYAGPTIAERRKTDERNKLHLSPHKKPHVWTLTVEWTETNVLRRTKSFTSRAARDESRRRIERHFKEAEAKKPDKYSRWWSSGSPFFEYGDERVSTLKDGPQYVESYDEVTKEEAGRS